MSAADIAVQAFHTLEPEDIRALLAIEKVMAKYRYAPENVLARLAGLPGREISYRLRRLSELGLTRSRTDPYPGFTLNAAGYDCLSIKYLVKGSVLDSFGKNLGVGKESDVYDALTPQGTRVAVKFHRLGRISFRQTRRLRDYTDKRVSWLYQSRLAAKKEFEALKLVHSKGVSVPEPIKQNRHTIVMGLIEGAELHKYIEIPEPEMVLNEIILNIRKSYIEAEVIHADLSEFNVILKPDQHIQIIDWPQFVKRDHPNAENLLKRDVKQVLSFFKRKYNLKMKLSDTLAYVKSLE